MKKRIFNEIKRSKRITEEHFDNESRILTFLYQDLRVISLKIPYEYPFRPPFDLQVNFIPINYYSMGNKSMLSKYLNVKCLCCSTILCSHNWNVQKNLEKICEEYIYFKDLINASIIFNHIELTNQLPEDMIKIIAEFLN
jgi:hypothetical protein